LSQQAKISPFSDVRLIQTYGAYVTQHTDYIGFGRSRNYLALGVPLLASTSPSQFQSILAHEIGHIVRRDGEFSTYALAIEQAWQQCAPIALWFANWYLNVSAHYAAVSARLNEYGANDYAAQVTNSQQTAEALIQISIKSLQWDQVFKAVFEPAIHHPEIPPTLFSTVGGRCTKISNSPASTANGACNCHIDKKHQDPTA
jgi:Zn-dependent protease with chaperone function